MWLGRVKGGWALKRTRSDPYNAFNVYEIRVDSRENNKFVTSEPF